MSYMTFPIGDPNSKPFENSPFNYLGKECSAFKKFDNTHFDNVNITYVYVGLRKIGGSNFFSNVFTLGANHWSVILELSNGKYACVQLDTTGKIDLRLRNSLRGASLLTWGRSDRVRLSRYGYCKYNYNKFVESLYGYHWYILGVNDCQNFARRVVDELTGKWVGVYPIEDGPEYEEDKDSSCFIF